MTSMSPRALTRVTSPALEPLTLAETKLYLRVDHPDDDQAILRLIQSAREAAEEYLRRSLLTQDWQIELEEGAHDTVSLPRGPVQSILAVERLSALGAPLETVPTTHYRLDAARKNLVLNVSIADRLRIAYRTGNSTAESLPASIRQGLLVHVAALYEGDVHGLPEHALSLYAPYRERTL